MVRAVGYTTIVLGVLMGALVLFVRTTAGPQEAGWPRAVEGRPTSAEAPKDARAVRGVPLPRMMHASITTGGAPFGDGVALVGQPMVGTCANEDYRLTVGGVPGLLAPRFGDFDRNLWVNLRDYRDWTLCLSGPGVDALPVCPRGDADRDADVDLKDLARFMQVFTGGS
jgi:hypothetical protein